MNDGEGEQPKPTAGYCIDLLDTVDEMQAEGDKDAVWVWNRAGTLVRLWLTAKFKKKEA